MSLENLPLFTEIGDAVIDSAADVGEMAIDTGESLFTDVERVSNLMHNLGGVTLEQTVELQSDLPGVDADAELSSLDDTTPSEEEPVEEEEPALEEEDEELEEEQQQRSKKKQPPKPFSQYNGSETAQAAMDFIYIATAIPADEIAA